jgi:hypothetical protein
VTEGKDRGSDREKRQQKKHWERNRGDKKREEIKRDKSM